MALRPDIYEMLAQAEKCAESGQDAEAIKLYRKLMKRNSEFTNLYSYHLGNLYGKEGPCKDQEEALKWYAKVRPNTVSKQEYCDVLRYQGNINRQLGRPERALSFYMEADRLEDPVTQNVLGLLYHYGDGFQKDTDKAVHYYKRAIQNGSADAMVNLSDIYKKSPDTLYEAITLLQNALSKNQPDARERLELVYSDTSTETLRTLCRSMPEEEKYGDARLLYLAERARREDSSCFYAYGLILKKRDRIPEAIEAFKKAPASKTADAWFELGKLTEGEESKEYFEKCIQYGLEHQVTTTTKKAMTKLALYYKELGQFDKAVAYNEMAISHGYNLGYLRLGEIYREKGMDCAEACFLQAYNAGRKQAAMYLFEYAYARQDYTAARKWCEETPQKKGNQKLYRLALLTWYGLGMERDEEKAIELLKEAIRTEDAPGLEAEQLLFTFYVYGEKADPDTFRAVHQLVCSYQDVILSFIFADFPKHYQYFKERVEGYFLQGDPSWQKHFSVAEHYLSNEFLMPSIGDAVRHIAEGLGYSWEEAAASYTPPQYPIAVEKEYRIALKMEMSGTSRYELIKQYRPLAEQGHRESMYRLFNQLISVTKYGTPEYAEVSKWLAMAEQYGHPGLQKEWEPLVGFIAYSFSGDRKRIEPALYEIEAVHRLARRCEEKGGEKYLAAARVLYRCVVALYEEERLPIVLPDGFYGRSEGYRYYCIYNLYCTSLIKDKQKEKEWLEKMSGHGYPPASLVWLREHNPHPLYRYDPEDSAELRKCYQEILDWGELRAEAYL